MIRNPDGEPAFTDWQPSSADQIAAEALAATSRPLILVDGRSGGGKTTFAIALVEALGADLVHTDDVAWYESFFGWDDLLADHVITPWREGRDVDWRPEPWRERGRAGSITARADRPLVIEGVGAARPTLREFGDLVVWVQSDRDEARRRGVLRDIEKGRTPEQSDSFWDEWEAHEQPFQAESRPWEVADLVILGTPDVVGLESGRLWATGQPPRR